MYINNINKHKIGLAALFLVPTLGATLGDLDVGHFIALPVDLVSLRVQHHPRDCVEHLIDVDILLGTSFVKWHLHQVRHSLGILGEHHLIAWIVVLVSNWGEAKL